MYPKWYTDARIQIDNENAMGWITDEQHKEYVEDLNQELNLYYEERQGDYY